MKNHDNNRTALELCRDINKRLDTIELLIAVQVKASDRFKVGQRVEFSPHAIRQGLANGMRARTGRVEAVKDHSVNVLIDGYKHPQSYFHPFWQPSTKRKAPAGRKGKR